MRVEGAILPIGDARGFTFKAWLRIVGGRPEFRRAPAETAVNPFTGQTVTRTRRDRVEVIVDGHPVGEVSWPQSGERLLNVSIEDTALSLVLELAGELDGEFQEGSPVRESDD